MRGCSPWPSSVPKSRLIAGLVAIGTCAVLILIVVLMTGGFVLQVGPLRFSSRRWGGPFVIAGVAWLTAMLHGRQRVAAVTSNIDAFLERYALALTIALAAAAAGTGIAHGTYAASGSDASGYVSQADLIASGQILRDEPLVRQVTWPNAGWVFSPLGYRPGADPGTLVPTYPMGLPLTMAAAHLADRELGPFVVVPLLGALTVLCTYLLGAHLHSRTAGVVAAALLVTSPIFLFQLVQPLSDVPATGWWALALVLAASPRGFSAAAAGAVSGLALLTRPNLLPLAIPIALVATCGRLGGPTTQATAQSKPVGRLIAFMAGLAPPVGALLVVQFRLYGAPWASGYGAFDSLFSMANVGPNLQAYALRLWRGETASICAAVAALGVIALSRSRQACMTELRRACAAAGVAGALLLLCYLPYGVFEEWSYLRFLLPAFPLALGFVAALLTCGSTRLPKSIRGLALVMLVTAACSANVVHAQREQAFRLQLFEARYRTAGRYLEAMLPADAVVLAVQESGSVAHYARRPVVRWDALSELDAALDVLRSVGRRPVLLVEDWEAADLLARFPTSPVARLSWPPRAEFGDQTRVRLFDPADLGDRSRPVWADRVH
jgi:hypothetical protein